MLFFKNYVKHLKTKSKMNGRTLLNDLKYELMSKTKAKDKGKL